MAIKITVEIDSRSWVDGTLREGLAPLSVLFNQFPCDFPGCQERPVMLIPVCANPELPVTGTRLVCMRHAKSLGFES